MVETKAITSLYNCLIRSILEYCCVIWSPYYQCHISRLEQVQNKFLKYLLYKHHIPSDNLCYEVRAMLCGYQSLEVRRHNYYLYFLYKLIHGKIDCPQLLGQLNFRTPRILLRQNQLFSE